MSNATSERTMVSVIYQSLAHLFRRRNVMFINISTPMFLLIQGPNEHARASIKPAFHASFSEPRPIPYCNASVVYHWNLVRRFLYIRPFGTPALPKCNVKALGTGRNCRAYLAYWHLVSPSFHTAPLPILTSQCVQEPATSAFFFFFFFIIPISYS